MIEQSAHSHPDDLRLIIASAKKLLNHSWANDSDLDEQNLLARTESCWREFSNLGLIDCESSELEHKAQLWVALFSELGATACPLPLLGHAIIQTLNIPLQTVSAAPIALSFGHLDGAPRSGCISVDQTMASGTVTYVEGVQFAKQCLVISAQGSLWSIDIDSPQVTTETLSGYARPSYCQLTFDNAPARQINTTETQLEDAHILARLFMTARAYGGTRRLFELVVEYTGIRSQFGQTINRYQAIQHKLADCLTTLDGTAAALADAAAKLDRNDLGWRYAARAAHAFATTELRKTLLEIQHTFGAIGYSEEHEAPRHFRRIHADLVRFGGANLSRAELARDLIDEQQGLPELSVGPADIAFRQEVREWLNQHWTDQRRAEFSVPPIPARKADKDFSNALGETGWLAMSWPEAFGGQARSAAEQLAFIEEFQMVEAPRPAGMEIQAIALMQYGSQSQQETYLPLIKQGKVKFCLGYSEPQSGSDLASMQTRAVLEGDEWVINGQKLWTTFGDEADYMWLAAKTDPKASPPHAGVSVFIIPMDTAGLHIRPSLALYGHTFSTETFDNVRVPKDAIVGEINQGWKVITSALATERVVMGASVAMIRANFMSLLQAVVAVGLDQDPMVRNRIGEMAARTEIARQLLVRCVKLTDAGEVPVYEAAMSKVFSTELMEQFAEQALDILGTASTLEAGQTAALTDGRIEYLLRRSIMMVIGGGTSEIQRNIIAQRGLKLPR